MFMYIKQRIKDDDDANGDAFMHSVPVSDN